jgi:hypothetical protein
MSLSRRLVSEQSLIGSARQRAQEITESVGQCMKLETNRIEGKGTKRQPRPLDRAFALFDPRCGTLIFQRRKSVLDERMKALVRDLTGD